MLFKVSDKLGVFFTLSLPANTLRKPKLRFPEVIFL